ncbi:helix-turn-helix transcriptional regulator [Nonomuraea sp. K274]|uniref:Helix-turn-helix transcriptional regulator n=2 Tax=Nonomuraea cypriaca TaxID=1187855 RepID=A0A931EXJ5_9ACTN|nr:helix-turn-helix transcriptional regulator [Nonomuraea cypriaca]
MRQALAVRDIAAIFRLLARRGLSQRVIAARTGQAQSEVCAIVASGRQVMAYDVLSRIADGLGIPRGYMGLPYDTSSTPATASRREDDEQASRLLAHAAQVTVGAIEGSVEQWADPLPHVATPVPERIGITDVAQVESATCAQRVLDYQHGGGVCRSAVAAQLAWSQQLLRASCSPEVARRLHRALADQHNLAGWTSFDVGLYGPARDHLARALEQARYANDPSLMANVLYRMGRVYLHCGRVQETLRFFQLGQICAQDASCERTVAMLCANEAWAYALLGNAELAFKSINRARDELDRAPEHSAPSWVTFFGYTDLASTYGMIHACLGPAHLETAVDHLTEAVAGRDPSMTRSRAFELTALAAVYLKAGEMTKGINIGRQAVTLATELHSMRVIDRLAPLQEIAVRRSDHHHEARDLAQRISALRAA